MVKEDKGITNEIGKEIPIGWIEEMENYVDHNGRIDHKIMKNADNPPQIIFIFLPKK